MKIKTFLTNILDHADEGMSIGSLVYGHMEGEPKSARAEFLASVICSVFTLKPILKVASTNNETNDGTHDQWCYSS